MGDWGLWVNDCAGWSGGTGGGGGGGEGEGEWGR